MDEEKPKSDYHSHTQNGYVKIRLETEKSKTEILEGILRVLKIRNEIENETVTETNGNLIVELIAKQVRKHEIPLKKYNEVQVPESDTKIRINIEKIKPRKFQFGLIAKQSQISKDMLESLVNNIDLLGKTSSVEKTFSEDGEKSYRLSFILDTDIYGINFIDAINEMIKDSKFLFAYEAIKKDLITNVDRYLGKWERGTVLQKSRVASDMQEMYEVLERKYEISMGDVLNTKKRGGAIPLARAAIAYIIRNKKYDDSGKKLSLTNIADILGGINHATVLLGINKCKEAELTENDLDNFPKAFEKIFKVYRGRKPRKI